MSRQVLRCAAVLRVSALAGLVSLGASCSRQSATQATGTGPAPSLPSSSETGLSLKRGILSITGEKGTFKSCGSDEPLWIVDQSDGSYPEVAANAGPNDALYVEVRGERGPVPEEVPEASAYAGAFILEQILYAGAPVPNRGCEAAAPAYIVRASGNELAWSAEVNDQKMEWMQDQGAAITFDAPRELDTEGAVRYEGRNDPRTLQLIIESQSCRDPSTEEFFAYSARAVLDGQEFKGCARVGR
jgi:uncharacterized membrane protein